MNSFQAENANPTVKNRRCCIKLSKLQEGLVLFPKLVLRKEY